MQLNSMIFGAVLALGGALAYSRITNRKAADAPSISLQAIEHDACVLLARGDKVSAIKRVQVLTGMGLKAAKDYVEVLQASRRLEAPEDADKELVGWQMPMI